MRSCTKRLGWLVAALLVPQLARAVVPTSPESAPNGLAAGSETPGIDPVDLNPQVRAAVAILAKVRAGADPTAQEWAVVCEASGLHPRIQDAVAQVSAFPALVTVDLLTHELLAVRTGALEMIEHRSRRDSGFDPWEPQAPSSEQALEGLRTWAAAYQRGVEPEMGGKAANTAGLDEAKLRGYLVDLVGNDVGKRERAVEVLGKETLSAIGFLERYLRETPQMAEGTRARIKEVQYRLVVRQSLPKEAARLARDLVYGTRDQKLAAMQALPVCRDWAVPILMEYLPTSDALVREAAMDALLVAGGESVYDLVKEHLRTETDENVIHAVLRRVNAASIQGAELIASFLDSENEDLIVAALNALSDGGSDAGKEKVMTRIADERWRVRVAALEYAGKLKIRAAEKAILAGFRDQDEFVRYAAMRAAADLELEKAVPLITELALRDDTLLGPGCDAIVRMGKLIPQELVRVLPDKPGEHVVSVLGTFGKRAGHDGSHIDWGALSAADDTSSKEKRAAANQALGIVRSLVKHRDPDVSATALHYLASLLLSVDDKRQVLEGLRTSGPDGQISLLESMRPGVFDFRESTQPRAALQRKGNDDDVFAKVLAEPAPRNPTLEKVYEAFGAAVDEGVEPEANGEEPNRERKWAAMEKEFHDLLVSLMNLRENSELSFHAATQLAFGGQVQAIERLRDLLPELPAHQRLRLANYLYEDRQLTAQEAGLSLLRQLLQDESSEVRQETVSAALRDKNRERFEVLLAELSRPDGNLLAVEVYGYEIVNGLRNSDLRVSLQTWIEETLNNPEARADAQTLALVMLGSSDRREEPERVLPFLKSDNVWLRRAGWRSMLRLDPAFFEDQATQMAADPSARVREVLAAAYIDSERQIGWKVWFGEQDWESEATAGRRRRMTVLPGKVEPLIAKLVGDGDLHVRLSAMLTLLSHGLEADPVPVREAIAQIGDEERRSLLIGFLDENYTKLSPQFGYLLDYVEERWFDAEQWKQMKARLRPAGGETVRGALPGFAALVEARGGAQFSNPALTESNAVGKQQTEAQAEAKPEQPEAPIDVIYFYKPGCKDCERVREMLRAIAADQPMNVMEHNIESREGAELNQVLAGRFQLPGELRQITPAVFTRGGVLLKTEVTYPGLQRLLEKTGELTADPAWYTAGDAEQARAGAEIVDRFKGFSVGWVAAAGLLDGINPCAFATIIFFLSYLKIARRTPSEILLVGGAFVTAVFLTYFAIGLGLSQVVGELDGIAGARTWLNRGLALVALILAFLSFQDGVRAWRGKLEESTLQLPEFLKSRIRSVIRGQARNTHFVAAAFGSGVIISLLELACTGQVYLPTIVYMVKQGSITAFSYLLLYNVAFVLPLLVIFVLAWLGMTSDGLIQFQKRHTAGVRFATGILFLTLWLVLLVA